MKGKARLIRWDRSGTIVSGSIDYNSGCLLADFFRRYSAASHEMRGFDKSVSFPTPEEAADARLALSLPNTVPLVKLEVQSPDRSQQRYYVVATPVATTYTPPGRGTRGFEAYGITECKRVYLKDTWRLDLPEYMPEGDTYSRLMKAKVRNIPQCLIWGDVLDSQYHATKTQSYAGAFWDSPHDDIFLPHRHYRLVLDIVGRKLTSYKSSFEAVRGIRDCLIGKPALRC